MKINNNIQALNSYRNLHQNQFNTSKNLEKLSSGLRINRASDDAAGLAISEKMRSQIRGLKMAERNAMDGISLMQTSEGAMQEVHTMLQRMRELAVQAANDTNTEYDREQIQKEIDQLKLEVDDISEKTEFNTRKLLNGFSAVLTTFDAGTNPINIVGYPKVTDANIKSGNYQLEVSNVAMTEKVTQPSAGLGQGDIKVQNPTDGMKLGEYTILVREVVQDQDAKIEVLDPDGLSIGTMVVPIGTNGASATQDVYGIQMDATKISTAGTVKVKLEAEATLKLNDVSDPANPVTIQAERKLNSNNGLFRHGGVEYQFNSNLQAASLDYTITNNALSFQIGPNTNQNVMIDIPRMDIVTLGIEDVNVLSNADANKAI